MEPITNSTVLTFGGVILLLQIFNLAVNIYAKLRRSPPIDQTLQDYVRLEEFVNLREEMDKLRKETRENDRQIFELLRQQQTRNMESITRLSEQLSSWQRGMERQIGRIEGAAGGGKTT